MSDRKRRTLWDSIKERVKKPIFKKGKKRTGDQEPGKKLMITALIGIETCKSTVLLKNRLPYFSELFGRASNNAEGVGVADTAIYGLDMGINGNICAAVKGIMVFKQFSVG